MNKYMVGANAHGVVILGAILLQNRSLSRKEALEFAAWIVTLAETIEPTSDYKFADALREVQYEGEK